MQQTLIEVEHLFPKTKRFQGWLDKEVEKFHIWPTETCHSQNIGTVKYHIKFSSAYVCGKDKKHQWITPVGLGPILKMSSNYMQITWNLKHFWVSSALDGEYSTSSLLQIFQLM